MKMKIYHLSKNNIGNDKKNERMEEIVSIMDYCEPK